MKFVMCAVMAAVAGGASMAEASIFYGVTGGTLVRMDTGAQTVVTVGSITAGPVGLDAIADCDFDAAGNLWVLRQKAGSFFEPAVNQAFRTDIATGGSLMQSDFGSVAMQGLAYGGVAGSFYSVNSTGAFPSVNPGHLLRPDLNTGALSMVSGSPHGLPGNVRVDAVAFAPNGQLYGVWNAGNEFLGTIDYKLVSFDTMTGLGSVIGSIGTSTQLFLSLRFDEMGVAYTVDAASGNVYTVDLGTGAGAFAFAGGAAAVGMTGLALQVPAPGAMAGMGLAMLVVSRRRRR